jgi:hypothetical protein
MAKLMLTVKLHPRQASVSHVCKQLKLSQSELDPDFGVVGIDPKQNLYAILVEEAAARRIGKVKGVQGPFSNPRIEPFGPPEKK